jgi:hypothetical protein
MYEEEVSVQKGCCAALKADPVLLSQPRRKNTIDDMEEAEPEAVTRIRSRNGRVRRYRRFALVEVRRRRTGEISRMVDPGLHRRRESLRAAPTNDQGIAGSAQSGACIWPTA